MPTHPAFLSRFLRLQICDWNFGSRGAFAARTLRCARKCRGLSEFFALGRLEISAGHVESRRCGHHDRCPNREHAAFVRTPARRIGSAIAVATVFSWLARKKGFGA